MVTKKNLKKYSTLFFKIFKPLKYMNIWDCVIMPLEITQVLYQI